MSTVPMNCQYSFVFDILRSMQECSEVGEHGHTGK